MSSLFNAKENWVINSRPYFKKFWKDPANKEDVKYMEKNRKRKEIQIPRGTTTYTTGDTREERG